MMPDDGLQSLQHMVRSLAGRIAERHDNALLIAGISGAQGSGKSTLAGLLRRELEHACALRTVVLSLDDLYLPGKCRKRLAAEVHPLLRTRGVPGTHDVVLGERLFDQLRRMGAADTLLLPRFDKGMDESLSSVDWPCWQGVADVLLFEGWCVGVPAQTEDDLLRPVNALEAEQDAAGIWRRYVNRRLADDYQRWFSALDMLIYLQVPSMREVYRWRWLQEQQLPAERRMSAAQTASFIQHFERLTRHAMQCMPARADIVLTLDAAHRIEVIEGHQP